MEFTICTSFVGIFLRRVLTQVPNVSYGITLGTCTLGTYTSELS